MKKKKLMEAVVWSTETHILPFSPFIFTCCVHCRKSLAWLKAAEAPQISMALAPASSWGINMVPNHSPGIHRTLGGNWSYKHHPRVMDSDMALRSGLCPNVSMVPGGSTSLPYQHVPGNGTVLGHRCLSRCPMRSQSSTWPWLTTGAPGINLDPGC